MRARQVIFVPVHNQECPRKLLHSDPFAAFCRSVLLMGEGGASGGGVHYCWDNLIGSGTDNKYLSRCSVSNHPHVLHLPPKTGFDFTERHLVQFVAGSHLRVHCFVNFLHNLHFRYLLPNFTVLELLCNCPS